MSLTCAEAASRHYRVGMRSEAVGADGGGAAPDPDLDVFDQLPPRAWRSVWDSSPALVAVTLGPEHILAYQNAASSRLFGARPLGMPMKIAFPDMRDGGAEPLDRALATGSTVETPPHPVAIRDQQGGEVVLSYVVTPVGDPPVGLVITAMDISAQVRAQTQAAQTLLLSDITNRMTAAVDAGAALQALTDALVPGLGDVAAVYVVPDDQRGDGPPLPPEVMTLSEELAVLGPPPPPAGQQGPSPFEAVLRSGRSLLIPVDEASLPALSSAPGSVAWLAAARANSIAVVPLVVAGTLTGVLLLLAADPRPAYREDDLPFLEDVAARAGAAISQLRTARKQREVAADLQVALLPAQPPDVAGLSAAARYVAGAPDVEVGGDWWDVHDLGAGRIALGIGDVSGRGVPAAAVMGQARAVMRAAGLARLAPADVLMLMDAQLADVLAVPDRSPGAHAGTLREAPVRFATACYAILDLERHTLLVANAGHLPILIRSASGEVRRMHAPPGAPLGLGVGGYTEISEPIAPDDTLVLFTDGLVESRDQDIDDGMDMLGAALASCGSHDDLDVIADALLDAMERQQGHGDDDVALVVVRVHPPAHTT
jgi:hypothetical protein